MTKTEDGLSASAAPIPTERGDDPWAELERLALAATPGPWFQCGSPWFSEGSGVLAGSPDPHVGVMIVDTENWNGAREEAADVYDGRLADADEDAAYIAAANPAAVLKLIAAARANAVGTQPEGRSAQPPSTDRAELLNELQHYVDEHVRDRPSEDQCWEERLIVQALAALKDKSQ